MSRKVNPRRKPATMADVEKAKREAMEEAVRTVWAIVFTCLHDKWGWGHKRLHRLWSQAEYLADSIQKKRVSIADLVHVLDEYDERMK